MLDRGELAAGHARARAAWPTVAIEADVFVKYWQERIGDGDAGVWRVEDLYLACGCAAGLPAALAIFEERFLSQVPTFVARVDGNAAFADEVKQQLRTRLLMTADGRAPRIADYTGHGPLARWLQVAALRTALNLRRGESKHELTVEERVAAGDPEMSFLRASSRQVFEDALGGALASLSARERTLLKFHFLDGLSTPQIAVLFKTHRTTVRRQINECHARLLSTVREHLRARLGMNDAELDSFLRTSKSHIDLSLSVLVAEGQD